MLNPFQNVVAYFQGYSNYTFFNCSDGRRRLKAETLSSVLKKFPQFIRVHKSTAINPESVETWNFTSRDINTVSIRVGNTIRELAIARRRVEIIKMGLDKEDEE
ncbi:LytTR family transcriptional regulator [Spirosoma sp. RP8]|uniref:LytTR family transcriptional regulator n=1 Tax=Spirosoma liriopis TaxID=2937440 RepID=A0ABT0HUU0_9BACT|nr:LytTR family DNA-binding domain-containing protein [Spirosoma liriopis]MCK8495275.1 LytTR family transcriptional regulator [Spirosoma liriopis]